MKVLLINPWQPETFPPPSIGYLQATLKAHGIDVRAMDLNEALSTRDDFDIVGVTFHSFSVRYAKLIREKFKCHLVCGGHHPSALPYQMLKIGYDQVVIGEGENAILEIIEGNRDPIVTSLRPDINKISFPDYSGLSYGGEMGLPVISSRGCPFSCSFCASSDFWKSYRMRSSKNVKSEIRSLPVKKFMFEDDNYTAHTGRVSEICDDLKGKGYSWQCASRAGALTEDLCKILYESGCHTVWIGVESLSQLSLDRCNKKTTVEKMITGIKTAEAAGLNTRCQFIVGIPDDTQEDIIETVRVMKRNSIHGGANIIWLLPNTEAYKRAKQRGFSDEVYLQSGAPFYEYEHPLRELKQWADMINAA